MSDVLLVVNASPLIFLGDADRLDLLHTLGAGRIIVPEPVLDEVIAGGHTDKAARAISDATWIEKQPPPPIPESVVASAHRPGRIDPTTTSTGTRSA